VRVMSLVVGSRTPFLQKQIYAVIRVRCFGGSLGRGAAHAEFCLFLQSIVRCLV
jgi:hypothetical protein